MAESHDAPKSIVFEFIENFDNGVKWHRFQECQVKPGQCGLSLYIRPDNEGQDELEVIFKVI